MYDEFGEMRHTCGVEWNEMVRGRGGLVGGGIEGYGERGGYIVAV